MKQTYLTLGAVIRNQEHYVKEWLAFHHLVGVERFVIVLHQCTDKTEERIRELPFQDKIHIHRVVNDEQFVQLGTYLWITRNYGPFTKWLMFIDSDEFFFGTREDDLRVILTDYEKHGGLASHWIEYGSNGHVIKPKGLSIEAFTKRAPDRHGAHYSFKSVIQPQCFQKFLSPHLAVTQPLTVTEDHREVGANWVWIGDRKPTHKVVRVNHYHVRSMEDWIERYKRGQCNDPGRKHTPDEMYNSHIFKSRDHEDVHDACILRFAKTLNAGLNSMRSTHLHLAYGSHSIALLPCLHWTQGPVLEVGAGCYSTSLLSLYSQSRYCRTMESDWHWLEKVKAFFPASCDLSENRGHEFQYVENYRDAVMEDRSWDIVFIDQGDHASRVETALRMKEKSRLVILHDTEHANLDSALNGYRYRYDLKTIFPHTGIASQVDDLGWLKDLLKVYNTS